MRAATRRSSTVGTTGRGLCSSLACSALLAVLLACGQGVPAAVPTPIQSESAKGGGEAFGASPRLALWLARKDELGAAEDATYDLVMSGWFEPAEAETIRFRNPSTRLLAGLSHTWVLDDAAWSDFLLAVANAGDPNRAHRITEGMYLMLDPNGDGVPDLKCSPPGWDKIHAMDPRHRAWRELILAFYHNLGEQPQHDGVIVDMVDAYPFCDGAWSDAVQTPMDATTWIAAQEELLGMIREAVPDDKWVLANAGHDFPDGSPFPHHLNGYLLENVLGSWGATLEEALASAQRALTTTRAPHIVVFAVDTDDTGRIDWARFRVGLAASLLQDNTYFAFDYGSRDHGGVLQWWFPAYYDMDLGKPLGPYSFGDGIYRRDFEKGMVLVAATSDADVSFGTPHIDVATGGAVIEATVNRGDARIFLRVDGP